MNFFAFLQSICFLIFSSVYDIFMSDQDMGFLLMQSLSKFRKDLRNVMKTSRPLQKKVNNQIDKPAL
jgi:hypothetical protein